MNSRQGGPNKSKGLPFHAPGGFNGIQQTGLFTSTLSLINASLSLSLSPFHVFVANQRNHMLDPIIV